MKPILGVLAIGVLAGAGCATNPVPVEGPYADVSRLEGEWAGVYSSPESGRHGDIFFRLEPGRDTAMGRVVMIPHHDHEAMPIADEPFDPETEARMLAQGLEIQFVRVSGNRVEGELAPYSDPECGCRLRTTFTGVITGDEIEGTFASYHIEMGITQGGWWNVRRKTERSAGPP